MQRILIVDDHPLFAAAVADILKNLVPDGRVVVAGTLAEAHAWVATHGAPDWVLLDLGLPDSTTHRSLQQLRDGGFGAARIIVCSAHDDELRVHQALQQGAAAFISKAERPAQILQRLDELLSRDDAIPAPRRAANPRIALPLSQRQCDIMEAVASGKTNKEVARELDMSPGTVKVHMREIFIRLGARSRTEAMAIYTGAQPMRTIA